MSALKHDRSRAEQLLAGPGLVTRIVRLKPREALFTQGEEANSIFYVRRGHAKLMVVSRHGKEAIITLLTAGDFVGEEALTGVSEVRIGSAIAIGHCTALKIERQEMIRVMQERQEFTDLFLKFLLSRSKRIQTDLIEQLFNSSEKRLARILLIMAEFGQAGEPEPLLPHITQQALADMIGTTRSRVSFFMNRFRKYGFIDYDGRIKVHRSLLHVILNDRLPGDNAGTPPLPMSSDRAAGAS